MSGYKSTTIGRPSTVGQLRALLAKYPDETEFGFRNGPLERLCEVKHGSEVYVVFDAVEPTIAYESYQELESALKIISTWCACDDGRESREKAIGDIWDTAVRALRGELEGE